MRCKRCIWNITARSKKKRLSKGLEFINQQIPTIEAKLQRSEARLKEFRRGQELIDPKLEAARQTTQYGTAQQELQASENQIRELSSRDDALQQKLPASVAQTSVMTRLTRARQALKRLVLPAEARERKGEKS